MASVFCWIRQAAAIVAALAAVMVGAALISLGVPLSYGITCDIAAAAGPHGAALACEAAAGLLIWRLWRRRLLAASDL